jgi:hypothetical protein
MQPSYSPGSLPKEVFGNRLQLHIARPLVNRPELGLRVPPLLRTLLWACRLGSAGLPYGHGAVEAVRWSRVATEFHPHPPCLPFIASSCDNASGILLLSICPETPPAEVTQ